MARVQPLASCCTGMKHRGWHIGAVADAWLKMRGVNCDKKLSFMPKKQCFFIQK